MESVLRFWVLTGFLAVGFWYFLFKLLQQKKKMKKTGSFGVIPKGGSVWPFIGETLDFIACAYTSPVRFMETRKSLHGKVFKTHIMGAQVIASTDADVNRAIMHDHGNALVPAYPKSVRDLMGQSSILQVNGPPHTRLHSLILRFLRSPRFKSRITARIQGSIQLSLSAWLHHRPVYVQDLTKQITFEVLASVLMSMGPGEELDFLKREFSEFIKALICIPINFPGTRLYKSLKARESLLKMVRKVVAERKLAVGEMAEEERGPPIDVVDALLRDAADHTGTGSHHKQQLLDSISSNIVEMMIPGEETVPMAMTLAVKFLSDCPVALNKLVEENMELKKRKVESHEDYSWTDYMSLSFTQNVINETLRMGNIINAVWRKATKDTEIKGHLIPEGWVVLASISSVHMDQEIYANPHKFDPWRWDGAAASNNNSSFTPFGGGQRLCPGWELARLEISIFLHQLVTTYRWVAEEDEIVYFPTVKLKRKLPITVTPLQRA